MVCGTAMRAPTRQDRMQLSYLDTTSPSPIASQVPSIPNLIGGVGIVGLNGVSRSLQIPGTLHFEPRLGLAYSPNSKTVVHAGFGIFWHPTATYQTNPASFGFTRKSTSIDAGTDGVTPLYNLSNPFPSGLPQPYGNNPSALPGNNTGSGPLSIELGQSISGNPRTQSNAYQDSWSFDIQRSLPGGFVLTAGYVGSVGIPSVGRGSAEPAHGCRPGSGKRSEQGCAQSLLWCHHRLKLPAEQEYDTGKATCFEPIRSS